MYTGWLSLAGTEIINNARARAYAAQPVLCHCPDLAGALGDLPSELAPDDPGYSEAYTRPAGDEERGELPAPWWDPGEPASEGFHGVVGLEFTGASSGTGERQWTEHLGDGGVPGALRRASRELEIRALLLADSERSLSYGIGWLSSALRGATTSSGCVGDDLCVLAYCPQVSAVIPPDEYATVAYAAGTEATRTAWNVVMTDGPVLEAQRHVTDGWQAEVSFVLRLGLPWWYREPVPIVDTGGTGQQWQTVVTYSMRDLSDRCDELTAQVVNCLDESPFCRGPFRPWGPEDPPAPPDPCFPTSDFQAKRALFRVPADALPEWDEKTPIVQVWTGAFPLRRLAIRWYDNPAGYECEPRGSSENPQGVYDQQCASCSEIHVPWIPGRSTLTIDGRTNRAVIECPGSATNLVQPVVYGPRGGLYQWPVFDCETGMCVELLADQQTFARDLRFRVWLAARSDAA